MTVFRRFGSSIGNKIEADDHIDRDFLVKLWVADRKMRNPRERKRRKVSKFDNDQYPRYFSDKRVLKQPPLSQSSTGFLDPESPEEVIL